MRAMLQLYLPFCTWICLHFVIKYLDPLFPHLVIKQYPLIVSKLAMLGVDFQPMRNWSLEPPTA